VVLAAKPTGAGGRHQMRAERGRRMAARKRALSINAKSIFCCRPTVAPVGLVEGAVSSSSSSSPPSRFMGKGPFACRTTSACESGNFVALIMLCIAQLAASRLISPDDDDDGLRMSSGALYGSLARRRHSTPSEGSPPLASLPTRRTASAPIPFT
jgi:hypothetical protein